MDFDWKAAVKSAAPTIGGLLATAGGPAGALAGAGLAALASALCGSSTGDAAADEGVVAAVLAGGMTPELHAKIIDAEGAYKLALVQAGVRQQELVVEVEKAAMTDTADARRNFSANEWVLGMAVFINVASYFCVAGVLWGCFVLFNGAGVKMDPATAALIGSIVGAALQWVLQNASQANSFAFGSSPSSRQTAVDLGAAVGKGISGTGR